MSHIAELEEEDEKLIIAVEDLSERTLWPAISQALRSLVPLSGVIFDNKLGKPVHVQELNLEFLDVHHPKLQKLKGIKQNPSTWFLFPYVHIVIVTAWEASDYKSHVRPKLRGLIDSNRTEQFADGLVEWLIIYIRPPEVDQAARGPRKAFEKIQSDFNTKRIDRCVRLDFVFEHGRGAGMSIMGLTDLEQMLRTLFKSSFQTRRAVYENQAKKQMEKCVETGSNFPTLYVTKDSLALMLDAVGLLEDALREFYELEACYLQSLSDGDSLAENKFGADSLGEDVATLMTASWKSTRQSIMSCQSLSEFKFRQYLFAAQARLLIKLSRPIEVLERGLKFIQSFSKKLGEKEQANECRPLFKEVWSFSACISVANTIVRSERAFHSSSSARLGALRKDQSLSKSFTNRVELSQVEWDIGICGLDAVSEEIDIEENALGSHTRLQDPRFADSKDRKFHCLLGHLYASAREELRIVGHAFEVNAPKASAPVGLDHAEMLPSFAPVCLFKQGGSSDSGKSSVARKSSSIIDSLQHKIEVSLASRSRLGFSSLSHSGSIPLDLERAPSWMTRAGLMKNIIRHTRTRTEVSIDPSPGSMTSAMSMCSEPKVATELARPIQEVHSTVSMESVNSADSPSSSLQISTTLATQSDAVTDSGGLCETLSGRGKTLSDGSSVPRSETSANGIGTWMIPGEVTASQSTGAVCGATLSPFVFEGGNWMSEWRIKRAVSSEDFFEDLFVEVTLAASRCYSRAGRARISTVLKSDVAPLLLRHGLLSISHKLYQAKSNMYAQEGWDRLRAHVLPQLIASFRNVDTPMLVAAGLEYLSLPSSSSGETNPQALQEEIVACAAEVARDCVLDKHLVTGPCLQISAPIPATSLFLGEDLESGIPHLCPPSSRLQKKLGSDKGIKPQGAVLANTGDAVILELSISSMLPEPLTLRNMVLVLVPSDSQKGSQFAGIGAYENAPESTHHRLSLASLPSAIKESRRSTRGNYFLQESQERHARVLYCPCTAKDASSLVLAKQSSKFNFVCRPLHEGLYEIQHILADMGSMPICIPMERHNTNKAQQPSWEKVPWRKKILSAPTQPPGSPSSYRDPVVHLQVLPACQRVTISAVASQESLIYHRSQWVGIYIQGNYERIETGSLSLEPVTKGIKLGDDYFICHVQAGTDPSKDKWVRASENGGIFLEQISHGPVSILVWTIMSFEEQEVDEKQSHQSAGRHWEVKAVLDYNNGCMRSHATLLKLPVIDPFLFETSQATLANGRVLVTSTVTSCLPNFATLQDISMVLTASSEGSCKLSPVGINFPCVLKPAESLSIVYCLSKAQAEVLSTHDDGLCGLGGRTSVRYTMKMFGEHQKAVHCTDYFSPLSADISAKIPAPPQNPPSSVDLSAHDEFLFTNDFTMNPIVGVEGNKPDIFKIVLLPPLAVAAGCPVALTWVFERLRGEDFSSEIQYTIIMEGVWQACAPLNGVVRIPSNAGSSSTLEAVFIPILEGDIAPPRLVLNGIKCMVHASLIRVGHV